MEVKSADDYIHVYGADVDGEHPHGDLDRIIIDGQIMPLRNDPPNKTPLRGEDIAFLAEAVLEREKFLNDWFEDTRFKFSRKITAGPAYAATPLGVVQAFLTDLGIHEDGYEPTGLIWFKPGKSWKEGPVGTEQFSAFDPSLFLSKKTSPFRSLKSAAASR